MKPQPNIEPTDLLDVPDYKGRVEYSPDIDTNCTLTLRNVTLGDTGEYHPRIITSTGKEKWLQRPGLNLTVTGSIDEEKKGLLLSCLLIKFS